MYSLQRRMFISSVANHFSKKDSFKLYSEKNTLPTKQLICISPAGFKGFYLSGVIAYIKEHYNISNIVVSGASAGAWNSLLFTYKGNLTELIYNLVGSRRVLYRNESIPEFEYYLKNKLLKHYTSADFDLDSIYIGVTTIEPYHKNTTKLYRNTEYVQQSGRFAKTSIYSEFENLEDVLDCCIASSHIPFITGKIIHTYNGKIALDGGFSYYPYYPLLTPILNITPNMWVCEGMNLPKVNLLDMKGISESKKRNIEDGYTTLLSKEKYDFIDLFWQGYNDTQKNNATLHQILTPLS